jgi:hypothetical protein
LIASPTFFSASILRKLEVGISITFDMAIIYII